MGPRLRPSFAWALASATLGLGGCDEGGTLAPGEAVLVIDPDVVDLGRVYVGREAEASVAARSVGARSVDYTASFGPGFGEGLTVGPARAVISPQTTETLVVRLDGQRAGPRDVVVRFAYGTATATLTIRADVRFPPDCEDGNICTENQFDFERGRCTSVATTHACNDLDACTTRDQCAQAVCLGESISCDDDNVCTDDFCDREAGCIHRLTRDCDDGNPCTDDLCDPGRGCIHRTAEDGTPCGEGETCRVASICIRGSCSEVSVPDGTECDDGDPCSLGERCASGECLDPDFTYPEDGELEWMTPVGPLAPGAERNPVVDVDGTVFVAVSDGVVALEQCGGVAWENRGLGTPDGDSMLLMPGRLVVPLKDRIEELNPLSGESLGAHDLRDLLPAGTATTTRLTSLDLVIRGSGALVGSVWVEPPDADPHGSVYEIPVGSVPLVQYELGDAHAAALALDQDESVILLLRRGPPGSGTPAPERVVRLGPDNLPGSSWSSSAVETASSHLAIDAVGEVLWTAGLRTFSRTGSSRRRWPEATDPFLRTGGSAVVDRDRTYFVALDEGSAPGLGETWSLIALDRGVREPAFVAPLPGPAPGATPGLDADGNVYVVTRDAVLTSRTPEGELRFQLELPTSADLRAASVAVTASNLSLVIGGGHVFGVQADPLQSTSAWFRYRRDNFSTGHR